ncbi:ABC transporter permease [uncultured Jatrophihabitans sp.]|uniref:ABC transporter permease n=1 Tax=uncultured Jatrophihabitans sp. TaxID=1610747 RepID=UPI0035C97DE1
MTIRDASAQAVSDAGLRADRRADVVNRTLTRLVLAAFFGLVALSLTRVISGQSDLTSDGALGGAINAAMPIMLAGLGGLWSERSGVVNIGLEGEMIFGTWFAAEFVYKTGSPWMLLVGGLLGGLIGGVLHAIATVGFGVDQIISGVAINLLAPGVTKYLSGIYFNTPAALKAGGGPTQSPKVKTFSTLDWHAADHFLTRIQNHHWFLLSDLAGLVNGVLSNLNLFTIIALLLIPLTWFVLWRTSFGLRLRSCGENPTAAETLGVKVYTMKSTAVVVSGLLAGLGGAFLVEYTGIYHENQTAGRGYIGLAAMIFGNWRPGGLLAGSSLFGYTDALQQQFSDKTVHALLLLIAIVLFAVAAYALFRRHLRQGIVALVAAALLLIWYLTTDSIPDEFATYSPQIITLFVLAIASQRLRMPAADGLPWRRGQGA